MKIEVADRLAEQLARGSFTVLTRQLLRIFGEPSWFLLGTRQKPLLTGIQLDSYCV
jgi:hypothetical protein